MPRLLVFRRGGTGAGLGYKSRNPAAMSWLRLGLAFLAAALMAGEAQAGKRIALVIGNAAYAAVSPLTNPKNDADLMAKTLQSVGFEVTKLTDADQRAMKQAMLDFGRKLHRGVEASLFYYSGHGVQAKGENYLIPVDAAIKDEGELDLQAIDVNAFLQVMDNADSKVNIIILDACRNNPFAASTRSASRGLAMLDAPQGTYIAFSTGINQVAEDGDGENSPYTDALAKAMVKPGVKLEDAFKEARRLVLAATDGKQLPWETTSITGDFYFVPPTLHPLPPPPVTIDELEWDRIANSTDVADFDRFLQKFPQSRFATEATSRRASLGANPSAAETACFSFVQGNIPWSADGASSWMPANIRSLCQGTTKAAEPGRCFDRIMHGGINWGGGTKWQWQNALKLCKGTSNAEGTVSCFQAKIAAGERWGQAIAECKVPLAPAATSAGLN